MSLQNIFIVLLILFGTSTFASENNIADKSADKLENVYMDDKPNIVVDPHHTVFTIKLKSNRTTGYAWFLREYNYNLITPVKHSFQASNTKLIGAPGYELWTFQMKPDAFVVPQQMIIRLIYARPWQGADNSTQVVFRVTTTQD